MGDAIYRYMSAGDQFSPDHLLNFLNLSSEHEALEIADRVEAAMYVWRRKASMTHVVSKWENVTELNADGDKNLILASRARSLLLCLKQRFPGLSQTTHMNGTIAESLSPTSFFGITSLAPWHKSC